MAATIEQTTIKKGRNILLNTIPESCFVSINEKIEQQYKYKWEQWFRLGCKLMPFMDIQKTFSSMGIGIEHFNLVAISRLAPATTTLSDIFDIADELGMPGVLAKFTYSDVMVKTKMPVNNYDTPALAKQLTSGKAVLMSSLPPALLLKWGKEFKDKDEFRNFCKAFVPQAVWETCFYFLPENEQPKDLFDLYLDVLRHDRVWAAVSYFTGALAKVGANNVLAAVTKDLKEKYGYAVLDEPKPEYQLEFSSNVAVCSIHKKLKDQLLDPCNHLVCSQCAPNIDWCFKCKVRIVGCKPVQC